MPGWLSWLERTAHRVLSKCSDFFLGYREAAGSNPAPGTPYKLWGLQVIPVKFSFLFLTKQIFSIFV